MNFDAAVTLRHHEGISITSRDDTITPINFAIELAGDGVIGMPLGGAPDVFYYRC